MYFFVYYEKTVTHTLVTDLVAENRAKYTELNKKSYRRLHIGLQVFTINWHKKVPDRLNFSKNSRFLMSIKSHIVITS